MVRIGRRKIAVVGQRQQTDTMGRLRAFEKPVSSTADDPEAINMAAHLGTEKMSPSLSQLENGDHRPPAANAYAHVTPEMEKAVVRKLDNRLVPLVTVLCRFEPRSTLRSVLTMSYRPACVP